MLPGWRAASGNTASEPRRSLAPLALRGIDSGSQQTFDSAEGARPKSQSWARAGKGHMGTKLPAS